MKGITQTDGIVIGVRDLGEADRISTLLTPEHGVLRAVVRGGRRPRNRLAAGTQLFTSGSFMVVLGNELHTINQVEIRGVFGNIQTDILRMAVAAGICEVAGGLSVELDSGREMFQLVQAALTVLDRGADPITVLCRFLIRAITIAGFGPRLDECVNCGGEVNRPMLDAEAGGLVCSRCKGDSEGLCDNGVHGLRVLAGGERTVRLDDQVKQQLLSSLGGYVGGCLERPVRSLDFVYRLLAEGQEDK